MILDVLFNYNLSFVAPRRRTVEYIAVSDVFPVEIREINASDAPVAFWTPDPASAGLRVPYRSHGAGFMRPVYVSHDDHADPARPLDAYAEDTGSEPHSRRPTGVLTSENMSRMAAAGFPSGLPSRYVMGADKGGDRSIPIGEARRRPGRLDEGNVAERLGLDLQRYAGDLSIVDGIVHVACPYPFLDASPYMGGVKWPSDGDGGWCDAARLYPVERYDEALAEHLSLLPGRGSHRDLLSALRPRILRPDLLPAIESAQVVARAVAARILAGGTNPGDRHRWGPPIADEPKEVMTAWAELKAASSSRDDPRIEAALRRFSKTPYGTSIVARKDLEDALGRIDRERSGPSPQENAPCV